MDLITKLHIAIKEANESNYWLLFLSETDHINNVEYLSMNEGCKELLKLLTASLKTAKAIPK